MPSYRIVEQEPGGRYIVTNAQDANSIWAGSHWLYRDQSAAPLISLVHHDAAENYCERILGGKQ